MKATEVSLKSIT